MGRTMRRTAALTALWRAVTAAHRGGPGLGARLMAAPRLIFHSVTGRYDGFSRVALMSVATLYIVSPIDLIPEIPFGLIGLIDDTVVLAWLAGAFLSETDRFLEWERIAKPDKRAQSRVHDTPPPRYAPEDVIDGQVVD